MKNNWKVWRLYDKSGALLAEGRKKHVLSVEYPRYVYGHIFTDRLVQTAEPLYSFQYSITFNDQRGHFGKTGFGTEEAMFAAAVAVDREGGELLSAVREVYERRDNMFRCIAIQQYSNGVPQV